MTDEMKTTKKVQKKPPPKIRACFAVEAEVLERLRQVAQKEGVSVSWLIAQIVREWTGK